VSSLSRRLPSPAMVVAVMALVVAASGTAVAASALVNGDKLIRKGTLSGNRLRDHTITGRQVKLSKLGTVPSAAFAANAGHASSATTATNATNATVAAKANSLPPLQWTPLSLINGWQDYNAPGDANRTPAYAVDAQGIVHLRGAIMNPSTTANEEFAVLPAPLVPSVDVWLATDMLSAATGRIDIFHDGGMWVEPTGSESTATGFTNLDGITWAAG